MKKMIVVLLLNFWLALIPAMASPPVEVSIVQLIAASERFDGKLVSVVGFFQNEMEATAIYLHREDAVQGIRKNGVWVELTPPQIQLASRLNNGYVKIEGVFSASDHGHFGLWSGSINGVKIISGRVPPPSRKKKNLMRMK
ncbi:hypothetical protein PO883_31895 [Massilia sp. DJPM01]|uniref:hypothetical protein n=1 Tax=Massilia sp. DJPM01 TaxID=3024404 RepID=UPI00259DE440|nr:hypothetical protein [Massilia sp. DJPM01]MDM5181784.1 hypothetical protein [Massilia sp. DJPM01]